MPKWILAILAVITGLVIAMVLVALQMLSTGRTEYQEIKSQSGGKATIIAPVNEANQAKVSLDEATGQKVLAPRAGLEGFRVPEFKLVNQDGEPVDESLFEGRVTILNFIFTNCLTACPPMTANTVGLYHELADTDVQFVSISVDPVHDTPEQLREYAGRFGIDHDRWVFLTGPEGEASRVCSEALQFEISEDPDASQEIQLGDGTSMTNILHPIKLFLIGPDRQILDFCAHQVEPDRERFAAIARDAAE